MYINLFSILDCVCVLYIYKYIKTFLWYFDDPTDPVCISKVKFEEFLDILTEKLDKNTNLFLLHQPSLISPSVISWNKE